MVFKKLFSIIIALIVLVCLSLPIFSAYHTTAFGIPTEHLALYADTGGAGLLSYQGGRCHYERLSPDSGSADLSLEHTIASAAVFGNTVVALCNDVNNDQLEVYTYRTDTDILDRFTVNDLRCYSDVGFYYDTNSIYLISDRRADIIERYGASGVLIDRYLFNSAVTQIGSDYSGHIFAVSNKVLYRLDGNRFTAYSGVGVTAPVTFFDNEHLTDASGRVFRIEKNTCELLWHADASFGRTAACMIDGIVYYPYGGNIYGYRLSTGEKHCAFSLNDTIIGLYTVHGYVYAVCNSGSVTVNKIRAEEFTDLSQRWESTSPPFTPGTQSSEAPDGPDYSISSTVYQIDFNSYRISGIPAGTTFAQLKKNILHNGYTVRLYRDGSEKKSGNCGTAMKAVFESDRADYTFELSVIGDLTGEGNVNSRDLNMLMEYLIGVRSFNGVYCISADLSGDNVVDVKDLALLHRMY